MMRNLCSPCGEIHDRPLACFPAHLVHPEDGTRMVWDVRGLAVCPECGAIWRFTRQNTVELVIAYDHSTP
jgi:hypothetical protein